MTAATTPPPAATIATGADGEVPLELNLGCGRKRRPGCLNVDVLPQVQPDLVMDLDRHPYPLPRDHFQHIYAHDVVEHLADIRSFMEEAHALLAPGGVLEITTPHFSSANSYTDPTHRFHLSYFSFDYFTAGHQWDFYSAARFRIVERFIAFHTGGPLARLMARFANRHPQTYERRFAWIYPAWFLQFKLSAVKVSATGGD